MSTRTGERSLVRAAQRGSADAKEMLVRRYWDDAHRAAFLIVRDRAAAEDIAQESMVAAIEAIHRFDRRRRFRPWLHRIVVNRSRDWVRARERRPALSLDRDDGIEESDGHRRSHPVAPNADAGAALNQALGGLDPTTRTMVVLRYLLDYRAREIGEMLEVSEGAVRTRLHRALAQLREELGPVFGPEPVRALDAATHKSKEAC